MNKDNLPGLYVHVPFCKTKCPYCDFYSITDPSLVQAWLEAIQQEVFLYNKEGFLLFDTLYIGGGTPSLLDEHGIEQLIGSLREGFAFSPDAEVTIEVNPDDVTPSLLACYKRLGINRLSIGVHSLQDDELRFLQRRLTAAGAERAIGLVKSSGFQNIGVDLIYGFPCQTGKSWKNTLERVMTWGPVHLSCYQFTVSKATPFGRMVADGSLHKITEEREKRFFVFTSRFLHDHGFIHYEISNFAKEEGYFSQHNLKYWHHMPYLGLGPGAHSFRDDTRWWNHRSVKDYCSALFEGKQPMEGCEELSFEQVRLEKLMLGFRTQGGIRIEDIVDLSSLDETLMRLQSIGIIKVEGGIVTPTLRGYLIADRLPLMFSC